ncbi:unnamed protein product [Prorocentrum cordatum]|uniref:Uncharacterized protein n=1 Tax=Prorocentrum cordatum TaxID=2364126 RepID=A0ABN9Q716_9DINO|nr:unnamed protein product [Polarella glacialis]
MACVGLAWAADPQEEDACQLEGAPRCVLYYGKEPVKATTSIYQQYDCYMAPMLPAAPAPALLGAAPPPAPRGGSWWTGFLKSTKDLPPISRAAALLGWALVVCACLLGLLRGHMSELCAACRGYAPVSRQMLAAEAAEEESGGAVGAGSPTRAGGPGGPRCWPRRRRSLLAEHGKTPLEHHFRVSLIWEAQGVDLDLWLTLPDGQQCGCSRRRDVASSSSTSTTGGLGRRPTWRTSRRTLP